MIFKCLLSIFVLVFCLADYTIGQLHNETVAHMSRVRPIATPPIFLSEYVSPRLTKRNLTWQITAYPFQYDNHTSVENVDAAATQAFLLWSSVCNLTFYQTDSETPDIEMKFLSRKLHNTLINNRSCEPFEPSEYAHHVQGSQTPAVIHFNDDKYFKTTSDDGYEEYVDLVYLMAHNIGHVLNFAHSYEEDSIMYRQYHRLNNLAVKLSAKDVATAQLRYGPKTDSSG